MVHRSAAMNEERPSPANKPLVNRSFLDMHALHEKGLQCQTKPRSLVSSRERRVAVVPLIPGHALHEKGLQGQKGVGPLVSSQAGRAAVVPRINRG